MGLSSAQSSRKAKFQADPRNTQWANDTDRFGHQQMSRMGWQPGRGLGYSVEGAKEHVKVRVKTDSKGLGHTVGQQDQPTGLDVFQRISGKLNGNEEEVDKEIQKKKQLSGSYLQFVPGGILEGTVKDKKEMKKDRKSREKQLKKAEKAAEKALRQAKRESKEKKTKKEDAEPAKLDETTKTESESKESSPSSEAPKARGIRATRNRYIAMKRKATADQQSLKEILML